MQKKLFLFGIAAVTALAMACGEKAATPVSPSPTTSTGSDAAADGSTLKVTAPTLYAPISGSTVDELAPNLVVNNSALRFAPDGSTAASLQYRFVIETAAGAPVASMTVPTGTGSYAALGITGFRVPQDLLQQAVTYRWRARSELGSSVGPWSGYWTFITPKAAGSLASYQNATELWDNLTDGKTIGAATNVQWIPGKGAKMVGFNSHITYTLQSTLTSGAIDFMVEGLDVDTNGGKTKVVSMQQGSSDITDNPYRFNVEKRGDDHPDSGKFRMRIITGNAATGYYDSDRLVPSSLSGSKAYVFHVTWGGGIVGLNIKEGSSKGPVVLNHTYNYQGTYRPSPHTVHIGAPIPRGGELDATVPGIIVRYFYVSPGLKWPGDSLPSIFGFQAPGQ